METLFLTVLNQSLTASVLIVVVLVLRLLLAGAPKWISCLLWAFVAVRLLCPFSVESITSLLPSAQPIPQTIMTQERPQVQTGIEALNNAVNPILTENFAPQPSASVNPIQVEMFAASCIWLAGMAVMGVYALISYLSLRRRVRAAIELEGDIRLCDDIASPFILGIVRPVIYLPSGIGEAQMMHIIAHERAHLRRRDHWWKPFGFLTLTIHWFNPLVWAAYSLLCRDIELACDEKVVREMGREDALSYSKTLLHCSVGRRNVLICPLAFGEVGVKERIRRVLHYKKPTFWVVAAALTACIVAAVCFLTDPKESGPDAEPMPAEAEPLSEGAVPIPADTKPMPGDTAPILADAEQALESEGDSRTPMGEPAPELPKEGAMAASGEAQPEDTESYVLVYLLEGMESREPAERITGDGYAVLLPKEEFQCYAPDAWCAKADARVQFWVAKEPNQMAPRDTQTIEADLAERGYRKVPGQSDYRKVENGVVMVAQIRRYEQGAPWLITYTYPVEAEEGWGGRLKAISDSFCILPGELNKHEQTESETVATAESAEKRLQELGDLDGNGQKEYVILSEGGDPYATRIALYWNGSCIYEYDDLCVADMGDVTYIDLDGDGQQEIFLTIEPHVNSMPLEEYVVLKNRGARWEALENYGRKEGVSHTNAFPITVTKGKQAYEAVIACEGCDRQLTYDVGRRALAWENEKEQIEEGAGNVYYYDDMIRYYQKDFCSLLEGERCGEVCAWGIWKIETTVYQGTPCLIAEHGIQGQDKFDFWGMLQVIFDYDKKGKIRIRQLAFHEGYS